jgi:hypothetical protein
MHTSLHNALLIFFMSWIIDRLFVEIRDLHKQSERMAEPGRLGDFSFTKMTMSW